MFVLEDQDQFRPLSDWDSGDEDNDPEKLDIRLGRYNDLLSGEAGLLEGDPDANLTSGELVSEIAMRFGIPESNIILEDGRITRIIDRDGDVINADNLLPDSGKGADGNGPDVNADNAAAADNAAGAKDGAKDGADGGSADGSRFHGNLALEAARVLNLDIDRVVDANGLETLFSDMDGQSQMDALLQMVDLVANADPFGDETERGLIGALRSGRSLLEIAREIVADDGQHLANTMGDYEVYAYQTNKRGGGMSPEEILEEFESLPDALRDKKVASYREAMRTQDTSPGILDRIAGENTQALSEQYERTLGQFGQVLGQIAGEGQISGVEVSAEIIDDLQRFVTAPSPDKSSPFIQTLSEPEQIVKAAFWYRNIDSYRESVNAHVLRLDRENADLRAKVAAQTETSRRPSGGTESQPPKKAETWNRQTPQPALLDGAEMF